MTDLPNLQAIKQEIEQEPSVSSCGNPKCCNDTDPERFISIQASKPSALVSALEAVIKDARCSLMSLADTGESYDFGKSDQAHRTLDLIGEHLTIDENH